MESRKFDQYELVIEILRRLHEAGVLEHVILIGSWCLPLYRSYLGDNEPLPAIRTRDMDFLIPEPARIHGVHDVPALVRDLGFVGIPGTLFRTMSGAIRSWLIARWSIVLKEKPLFVLKIDELNFT